VMTVEFVSRSSVRQVGCRLEWKRSARGRGPGAMRPCSCREREARREAQASRTLFALAWSDTFGLTLCRS
jgi:hypothetical protein